MKKSEIALVAFQLELLQKQVDRGLEGLAEVISATMSAIGTVDPDLALAIIDQLDEQRDSLNALADSRANDKERFLEAAGASAETDDEGGH